MTYLRYLCLFAFTCPIHIVLCFCFVFLRLVYHVLPVPLDCLFSIAPSVFSNVSYLKENNSQFKFFLNQEVIYQRSTKMFITTMTLPVYVITIGFAALTV